MAKRSKRWLAARKLVSSTNRYTVQEAMDLLRETTTAKFNESLEIAVRLGVDPRHADQMIRGAVSLPYGTGKDVRVLVFAQGDAARQAEEAGADYVGIDYIDKIQKENWFDFDKAVATPDMMPKVSRLGRVLGPRGLMPNPKVGTVVTADRIADTVRELKAGKIEVRVEKAGIIHASIGKVSMSDESLIANMKALIQALIRMKPSTAKGTYLRGIAISSTMGVGIRLDVNELLKTSEGR